MADNIELKKLSRKELLELLLVQTHRNDELEEKLKEAEEKLREREIALSESGSMAEAALRINGVMAAADKAAAQYLENIKAKYESGELGEMPEIKMPEITVPEYTVPIRTYDGATDGVSREMLDRTRERCREIEGRTRERCETMVQQARQEAQSYWDEVYSRIKEYSGAIDALKESLASLSEDDE